jgi:hypothetical protein
LRLHTGRLSRELPGRYDAITGRPIDLEQRLADVGRELVRREGYIVFFRAFDRDRLIPDVELMHHLDLRLLYRAEHGNVYQVTQPPAQPSSTTSPAMRQRRRASTTAAAAR